MKKLFDSIETTLSMQEQVRRLLSEVGRASSLRLATMAIERGVFDEEMLAGFQARGAAEFVRKALKAKLGDGLPFAGPVNGKAGDAAEWAQRELWTFDEAAENILSRAAGVEADFVELKKLHAWCLDKFGRAPEIPELLTVESTEAA